MENHSYTAGTGHHSPYRELPYHSTASVWLSMDPLSDKYPGVSPYVYCANNPVRLVDKDGRSWETPEDAGKANRMREQAEDGISWNNSKIQKYKSKLANTQNRDQQIRLQNKINEFEERNDYLQYGINGLNQMEESMDFSFHFSSVNLGETCFSEITPYGENLSTGIITIYSDSYTATRWHECTHVWDWMTGYFNKSDHNFDFRTYVLGHNPDIYDDVEGHALKSEFAFSKGRNHRGMGLRNVDRFNYDTLYNSRSIFDVDVNSYCDPLMKDPL